MQPRVCQPRRLAALASPDSDLNTMLTPDLISHATADGKISVLPWDKGEKQIKGTISRAFAGTAQTQPEAALDWCMGPRLATLDDPERITMAHFCMSLGLCTKGPTSTTFVSRDQADGDVAAVALVQHLPCAPPTVTCMDGLRIAVELTTTIVCGRLPAGDSGAVSTRGEELEHIFHGLHEAHANAPHIYLVMFGTEPSQQGKGHGAALLRAVSRLADAECLPVYLETGPNNRGLYEHFGYVVKGETKLEIPAIKGGDPDGDSWPARPMLAMVRPAAAAAAK